MEQSLAFEKSRPLVLILRLGDCSRVFGFLQIDQLLAERGAMGHARVTIANRRNASGEDCGGASNNQQ